jgi:hypothetical protein
VVGGEGAGIGAAAMGSRAAGGGWRHREVGDDPDGWAWPGVSVREKVEKEMGRQDLMGCAR